MSCSIAVSVPSQHEEAHVPSCYHIAYGMVSIHCYTAGAEYCISSVLGPVVYWHYMYCTMAM